MLLRGVQLVSSSFDPNEGWSSPSGSLRSDAWLGGGSLSVAADLSGREPVVPPVTDLRGWPVLHRMHVTQAPEGCDYDFLQAKTAEQIAFVEPVIGRS